MNTLGFGMVVSLAALSSTEEQRLSDGSTSSDDDVLIGSVQLSDPPTEEDDPSSDELLEGLLGEPDAEFQEEEKSTTQEGEGVVVDQVEVLADEEQRRVVDSDGAQSSEPFPLRGQVRMVTAFMRFAEDSPLPLRDEAIVSAIARGIFEHAINHEVKFETNAYLDISRSALGALAGSFATAGGAQTVYRSPYFNWTFWQPGENADTLQGEFGLDRLYMSWKKERVYGALGRFPINNSVTRIFTPNDFFAPFSATAINRMYKPGVDAARIGVDLGGLSNLELTNVLGFEDAAPTWDKSAMMLRLSTVQLGIEWAALGGKIADRWFTGASLQGDLGPVSVQGEGHVGFPASPEKEEEFEDGESKPYVRLASGLSYSFDWQRFTLGAEYAYNSDGAFDPKDYAKRGAKLAPDDLPYLAGHYVGASTSIELGHRLTSNAVALVNAVDASGMAALFFKCDVAQRADISLGFFAPWGDDSLQTPDDSDVPIPQLKSEFGLSPVTVFLDTQVYF